MEKITLLKHVTDGGAVYLTDNHRFADANIIIRIDGEPEVSIRNKDLIHKGV